jgi:hypothetical protein
MRRHNEGKNSAAWGCDDVVCAVGKLRAKLVRTGPGVHAPATVATRLHPSHHMLVAPVLGMRNKAQKEKENTYASSSESSVSRLLATLLCRPSDSSLWFCRSALERLT